MKSIAAIMSTFVLILAPLVPCRAQTEQPEIGFVMFVEARSRGFSTVKRLDGSNRLAKMPDRMKFTYLAAMPEGARESGQGPSVPAYPVDLGKKIAAIVAQAVGLSPNHSAALATHLTSKPSSSRWLERIDIHSKSVNGSWGADTLYLLPKVHWPAAQRYIELGIIIPVAEVDLSDVLNGYLATVRTKEQAMLAARELSERTVATLGTSTADWVGLILNPIDYEIAALNEGLRQPRRTCAVRQTDGPGAISSGGYRYLDSFAEAAAVAKDIRFNLLLANVEELFEKLQTKECETAVLSANEAAPLVVALQKQAMDFHLLGKRTAAELEVSYRASQADEPLQVALITQLLKTSPDHAQRLVEAGLTSSDAVSAALVRMASSGYSSDTTAETLLQFAADEREAAKSDTTANVIQQRRRERVAVEAAQQAEQEKAQQLALAEAEASEARNQKIKDYVQYGGIGASVIGAIVALFVALFGFGSSCPSCRKWFAKQELSSDLIDQSSGYEFQTTRDTHRSNDGKVVGTTDRRVQVHVTRSTYRNHNQCKHCGHEWVTQSTHTAS